MDEAYLDADFRQFMELMKKTTENLKQLDAIARRQRFQFGTPKELSDFVEAMEANLTGWISSQC
jgi:hypothetical protein